MRSIKLEGEIEPGEILDVLHEDASKESLTGYIYAGAWPSQRITFASTGDYVDYDEDIDQITVENGTTYTLSWTT